MVAFVIVSHSAKLAEGVIDLARMSAPNVVMLPAGGFEGGYGTSLELIISAINTAYTDDGVIILADMGSAVMTAEAALDCIDFKNVKVIDCPLVEGAVTGTVLSEAGAELDEIINELEAIRKG